MQSIAGRLKEVVDRDNDTEIHSMHAQTKTEPC